ncbi:MAG: sensor histidine kinase [Enterocloster sp.]
MKREKYFRDELQQMFLVYAIIPAVVFTLICGAVFMTAQIHGRLIGNRQQNQAAAGRLEQVLTAYEQGLEELAGVVENAQIPFDSRKEAELFADFYDISNELGYEAQMYILDRDRQMLLGSSRQLPEYLRLPEKVSWGIFRDMDNAPGQAAVRLLNGWKNQGGVIVLGRSLKKDGEPEGYILFAVESRQFQNALNIQSGQIIIADRFGWVFFSSSSDFLTESNQVEQVLEQAGTYLNYEKRMYLVSGRHVYHQMFRVYSVSDIQNVVVSLAAGGGLVLTALVLMMGWVLMNSRKMTEKKTEDFYRILDVLENAREGDLDSLIRIDRDNEFKIIADAYNETITSLKKQMENNRKMAELVAISQNKQLESQFNPHFLYNTLENIRYMCKLEPDKAERMVFSLSNLLRYSLDASKAEVTLEEDLEHLKNYLTILERRFGSRLLYQIEVEPDALKCRIPKLVLQPMLENAVKYGFGDQLNLKVELKAYVHEGTLKMICRDDGVGMSQTILSEITALLARRENPGRHSGLYNIHRRIELLYGQPYGVEIRSAEGHGTMLVVTLPARYEQTAGKRNSSDRAGK